VAMVTSSQARVGDDPARNPWAEQNLDGATFAMGDCGRIPTFNQFAIALSRLALKVALIWASCLGTRQQ